MKLMLKKSQFKTGPFYQMQVVINVLFSLLSAFFCIPDCSNTLSFSFHRQRYIYLLLPLLSFFHNTRYCKSPAYRQ